MTHFSVGKLLALLAVSFCLIACTSSNAVKHEVVYKNESNSQTNASLLVLGINEDKAVSKHFENRFVDVLSQEKVTAFSTHENIDKNTSITKESVTELVKQLGVDAVIVTRLEKVDFEVKESVTKTTSTKRVSQFKNLTDIFTYEVKDTNIVKNYDVAANVALVTQLYSAKDGELVITVRTLSIERTDKNQIEKESIEKIISVLKREAVI